jgi:hypothetical protein
MYTHRFPDELDDTTVEDLLSGRLDSEQPGLGELATLVTELRLAASQPTSHMVRQELAALFATGSVPGSVPGAAVAVSPNEHPSRRRRMLSALSTFVATLTGKVVLGTAVAAASVGAAHAVGVVDVPGLPEKATVADVPAIDNAGDNRPDGETAGKSGEVTSPGVDGSDVSDRATSGEPREDGKAFGTSVAEEAVEGTPAEGRPGAGADARHDTPAGETEVADEHRAENPAGGSDAADEYRPEAPADGSGTADEKAPDRP